MYKILLTIRWRYLNNPFIDISLKLKVSEFKSSELENQVKYLSETWLLNQHFWKTTLESIFLL